MRKFFILAVVALCFTTMSTSVKAVDIIAGRLKTVYSDGQGNTVILCKNRNDICMVVDNIGGGGTKEVELHFDTGFITQTVQDVIISPTYLDGEGNEITEVTLVPL
ncbi:MAG: hypothetical protein HYZ16_04350 [Bacteroidetes bacterium]|nr:hypothetical protein [Bacteroidota bacterium]